MVTSMATFMGGSRHLNGVTGTQNLWRAFNRFTVVTPSDEDLVVRLPNALGLALGGPYFYLYSRFGSYDYDLANHSGSVLLTVPDSQFLVINLLDNSTADGFWSIQDGTIPGPPSGPFYTADDTNNPPAGADRDDITADNEKPL